MLVGVCVGVSVGTGVGVGVGVFVGVGVGGESALQVRFAVPPQSQTPGMGVKLRTRVPLAVVEPKLPAWRWDGQTPATVPVSKDPLVIGKLPVSVLFEVPQLL